MWLLACGPSLTEAELLDPAACQDCHPNAYAQWSGSMHAYAAEDPVFLAMNARGQEETGGELGAFCVDCHAPMAVRRGATTDGLNLDEVDEELKGVTCAFCHLADEVTGTHNSAIELGTRRLLGGIADPASNPHRGSYSPLHDRNDLRSSELCGSCHDIVTPAGVHLERTYAEWQASIFSVDYVGKLTCSGCHMRGSQNTAADAEGVPIRTVHDHSFPGVDVALTDFPQKAEQRALIEQELAGTLLIALCGRDMGGGEFELEVQLDNIGAGHSWPSGAVQDRRAWIEVQAFEDDVLTWSSGTVPSDTAAVAAQADDPQMVLLRESMFDEAGDEVHMFWEAATTQGNAIPGPLIGNPGATHVVETWTIPGSPTRITAQMHIRPMGLEVLQDLVDSGHLDPAVSDQMPTFVLAVPAEWTAADGFNCASP